MPLLGLAALGPVFVGLMALLLIAGAVLLARLISHMLPDVSIPVLGNLRRIVAGAAGAALNAVMGWLDSAVGPVVNFLLLPYHLTSHLVAKVIALGQTIYNGLGALLHFAQHLYNLAVRWAEARYHQAISWADHVYNLAVAYAAARYRAAISWADHIYNLAVAYAAARAAQAISWADHVYNLAVGYAADLYRRAISWADHIFNLAVAYAAARAAQVELYAHALFTRAEVDLAHGVAAAERYALGVAESAAAHAAQVITTDVVHPVAATWGAVVDDVKALEQILATDLPDVGSLVRAIPRAVPADITAALAGVAAIDAVMVRYLRECGAPSCKSLSGLVKDLPRLFALAEGAGFLAFLAAMIADPDATSREVNDVVAPIVVDTVNGARHLIGL